VAHGTETDNAHLQYVVLHATEGFACPSSRRAYACLIGWNEGKTAEKKITDQRRCVETSGRIEPEVAIAGGLAHHFLGLIRRSDVSAVRAAFTPQ